MRPTTPHGVTLYILIQTFVRIQLWAITGKMKNLYRFLMPLQSTLYFHRLMKGVLVQNQINLPPDLANQTPNKILKDLGPKTTFVHHKIHLTSVGNCRNHTETKTLPRLLDHRRLSPPSVGSSAGMIRSHSHLISPINLGFIRHGRSPNRRVFLMQPTLNLSIISFKCSADRLLRRKTPLCQISSHRPNRKPHIKPLGNQGPNFLPRPQEKGQPQLIWATVLNCPNNLSRLPWL